MSNAPICPICGKTFTKFSITAHVEVCLIKSSAREQSQQSVTEEARGKLKKAINTDRTIRHSVQQADPNRVVDLTFGEFLHDEPAPRAMQQGHPKSVAISSEISPEVTFITDFSKDRIDRIAARTVSMINRHRQRRAAAVSSHDDYNSHSMNWTKLFGVSFEPLLLKDSTFGSGPLYWNYHEVRSSRFLSIS